MEKRKLGATDLYLSPLGLGTVKFGRNQGVKYPNNFTIPEEAALADLLAQARDLGVNVLDTAPAYGVSEERLGRLLKGQRKDWIIIGKAGENFHDGQSCFDFSPEAFEQSLQQSLSRLQTDYIDIFLIHSDGNDTDILASDVLIEKMHDFKNKGLVRAIGASTKTAEGGILALNCLDVVMATYTKNYLEEKSVLDYAQQKNRGILLKKALLSGHAPNPQEALQFGLSHPATTSIIVGTINPDHLKENIRAASVYLGQEREENTERH